MSTFALPVAVHNYRDRRTIRTAERGGSGRIRVAAYSVPVITIRLAVEADAPALRRIAVAAYRHYVARFGREPAPMTADYAAAARRGQAWVAAENGEAVGFIILIPQPGHLLLENVAVLPAAQGRGVGARLLALAEERGRSLRLPEVRLYTKRGDDRELGVLPPARVHRDPPGPAARFPARLLPQTSGHLTPQPQHDRIAPLHPQWPGSVANRR